MGRHRADRRDCPPNKCRCRSSRGAVEVDRGWFELCRPHCGNEADHFGYALDLVQITGLIVATHGTIEIAFPDHQTDFEAELAVVIGKSAKNVLAERALDFAFGYTIGLDISDRDLQKTEKQFGRCKSFDTYTPIGPFVYADVDVSDVSLELRQNGEVRQSTHTSKMIYSIAQIISFASQSLTLLPGDVILTGTPAGVGPIHPGDELEAAIDDWPRLRNSVAIARDRRRTSDGTRPTNIM